MDPRYGGGGGMGDRRRFNAEESYRGRRGLFERLFRRNRAFLFWFPALILYDELVFHVARGQGRGLAGVFYTLVFSLSVGCVLTLLSTLFVNRINVYIVITLSSVITLLFIVHLVFLGAFGEYFRWSSLSRIGEAGQYAGEAASQVIRDIIPIMLLLLPLMFYCIWGRDLAPALSTPLGVKGMILALAIMFHLTGLTGLVTDRAASEAYRGGFVPEDVSSYFGLMTEMRLDLFSHPDGEGGDEDPAAGTGSSADAEQK